MTARIRVGTQGWSYDAWTGPFYPADTRPVDRLALYARAFDVVEVDSTFYGLPPIDRFVSWRERTPEGFLFTLKMPGEVTHEAGLRDARLAHRFCQDARALGPKLGPILIQLPPRHGPTAFDITAEFLRSLPADLRFAIEFRDRAWLVPETRVMLEEAGVSLALSVGPWLGESAARSLAGELEPSLLYLRWLGEPASGRSARQLVEDRQYEIRRWAELLDRLEAAEVLAFFNNDYQGHSPASARHLQSCLGREPVSPDALSPQQELFG